MAASVMHLRSPAAVAGATGVHAHAGSSSAAPWQQPAHPPRTGVQGDGELAHLQPRGSTRIDVGGHQTALTRRLVVASAFSAAACHRRWQRRLLWSAHGGHSAAGSEGACASKAKLVGSVESSCTVRRGRWRGRNVSVARGQEGLRDPQSGRDVDAVARAGAYRIDPSNDFPGERAFSSLAVSSGGMSEEPGAAAAVPVEMVGSADSQVWTTSASLDASDPASLLDETGDERKLRCAVESILRDQEELRISAGTLTSPKTVTTAGAGIGLAVLGVIAATSPVWAASVLPVMTGSLFLLTSLGESAGTRAKGISRYNTAKAVSFAAKQETVLARAEVRKSFLPYGVGLATIFSISCVALRVFELEAVSLNEFVIRVNDLLLFIFAGLSVFIGAILTTNESLRMKTALGIDVDGNIANEGLVTAEEKEPALWVQALASAASVGISLLPVPFYFYIAAATDFEEDIFGELCVIVSATAVAVSAITFLLAEKDFADAERRISTQSGQAALAELFLAQCEADVAIMPLRSAGAAAALGGVSLWVEFSRACAAFFPLPALATAVGSMVGSEVAGVEADATWLERRRMTGDIKGATRDSAGMSTIRELKRVRDDVLRLDSFGDDVRSRLLSVPMGETASFSGLPSERRRKVHSIAAELGMPSQSRRVGENKAVVVMNLYGAKVNSRMFGEQDLRQGLEDAVRGITSEVQSTLKMGMPTGQSLVPATALAAGGVALPVAGVSGLALTLATAAVGLLTVYQEREGRAKVAEAKGCSAKMLKDFAGAEAKLGLATIEVAAIPTYLAVSTLMSTLSCVLLVAQLRVPVPHWIVAGIALACAGTLALCLHRQKRAVRNMVAAIRIARGIPLPQDSFNVPPRMWLAILIVCVAAPVWAIPFLCAALTSATAWVQGTASAQLATCQFYVARGLRNFALADCWAQEASISSRALPAGSALALLVALLATAPVGIAASLFPVVNLLVAARAMQLQEQSSKDAAFAREVFEARTLSCVAPPWNRWARKEPECPCFDEVPPEKESLLQDLRRTVNRIRRNLPIAIARLQILLLRPFEAPGPERYYAASPAERAVRSVQSDLDELRVSVRTSERSLVRTSALVAVTASVTLLTPFVLSGVLLSTILPLAGAGLTVFGVAAESDARRSVAASKAWAACLGDSRGVMEELVSMTLLYKSRLLSVTGVTSMVVIAAIGLEHIQCTHPWMKAAVVAAQACLLGGQLAAAMWCGRPLAGASRWGEHVCDTLKLPVGAQDMAKERPAPLPYLLGETLEPAPRRKTVMLLRLITTLPPLLLGFFPLHRSFAKRVVASTAAGAFVVSLSLFLTERVVTRAERAMCTRMRTYALADAFANEAETQGALLPLTSAAVIAISALIAVLTEVSPFVAGALSLPQALVWVIASRKALAAKFESATALQTNTVVPDEVGRKLWQERGGVGWQLKRCLLGAGFARQTQA